MRKNFIKGLELNEGYYHDVIHPMIESNYPELEYSVGLIGYGSDVLGFDTHISMDHNWGPRLMLFLSKEDIKDYKKKLDILFRKKLPYEYKGFPTNFTKPKSDGVQLMESNNIGEVEHLISIMTVSEFLEHSLGIKSIDKLTELDWLKFSDQGLIEITKGKIFYDGLKQLKEIREYFSFFPKNILRLKLASFWRYISNEEAFIGRNVDLGEMMGVKLITTRIINTLIKICFYIEGEYIPYSKWFARGFRELECYNELNDIFTKVINCSQMDKIEELICSACVKVVELQKRLNLSDDIQVKVESYYGRPYKVVLADKIANSLIKSISNERLKKISLDYISLVQNIDGIDLTENQELLDKLFSV